MELSTLSSFERQDQILRLVKQQQRITVTAICSLFSVSEATARRDLEQLASQGKLQRFHGGAVVIPYAPPEIPALQRSGEQSTEKQRIGQAAARLVEEGETIFLGSGTTVVEVARNLDPHKKLTVITNSLLVINTLAEKSSITLVTLGGIFRPSELSFIGHITEQALAEVRADKIFFGVRSLSLEEGLTHDYLPETMTDRAILRCGREVVAVADNTKFGRVSTAFVAPLSSLQTIVTDDQTSPDLVVALKGHGIQMIVT